MGGRPVVPTDVIRGFWGRISDGALIDEVAVATGVSVTKARQLFRRAGRVNPFSATPVQERYPSATEREEDLAPSAAGADACSIARCLGRDASTIIREVAPEPPTGRGIARRWPSTRPTRPTAAGGRRSWQSTSVGVSLNRPRFDAASFRVWKEARDHAEENPRGDQAAGHPLGA